MYTSLYFYIVFNGKIIRGVRAVKLRTKSLNAFESNLVDKITGLMHKGIVVVVTTQCLFEGSDLSLYEVGLKAAKAGVIPAHDMTTEAAVTKLMWVLGHTRDPKEAKRMMLTDMCGEISLK